MFVGSASIRGTDYCVALAVEGDHDVLVATACLYGESPGVIGVKLGKWKLRDVKLIGRGQFGGLFARIATWFLSGWCVRCGEWCKAV